MDLKLWEEYNKWIEEQNKPIYKMWTEMMESDKKRCDAYNKAQDEVYKKRMGEYKKELEDWDKLPWYKKFCRLDPYEYSIMPTMPTHMFPSFSWPLFTEKATYEGFLDWCVKNKKEL